MTLAINGTPVSSTGGTTTLTTSAAAIIIAIFKINPSASPPTVSDTAGLTWHLRASSTGSTTISEFMFWAYSPVALTSDVISANNSNYRVTAFGVTGANITTPFDSNPSLPATTSGASPNTVSISTNNPNTLLISSISIANAFTSVTEPTGFTQLVATGGAQDVCRKAVTAAQSSVSTSYTWTGTSVDTAMFVDAIQAAQTPQPYFNRMIGGM